MTGHALSLVSTRRRAYSGLAQQRKPIEPPLEAGALGEE